MNNLEKIFYAGPVTSLCFHNDIILLSGQGPYLKAFYVPTGKLLFSYPIIEYWRIYRIVPVRSVKKEIIVDKINTAGEPCYINIIKEQRLLAIYGSKTIQFVNLNINYFMDSHELPKISISLESRLSPLRDWIHDVNWLYDNLDNSMFTHTKSRDDVESTIFENNPRDLAIAFAHNFVEIWNIQNKVCVYSIQCEERCILYSARFFGETRNELILASGTVFNQVHLWDVMKKNESGDGFVYKKLLGHEGVIFGVRFSEDGKTLASVSDDRTVRIWKTDKNDNSNPRVLYGHTARVWDVHIMNDYLISISEDSTCRVWKNSIDSNDIDDVDCIACWEGHVGKNVWSLAINPSKKIVATGGGDSGIRLWSLLTVTNNKIDSDKDLIKIELPPIVSYVGLEENGHPAREHVRNFVLVDYCTIVIATNYGYNHEKKEWLSLYNSKDLQNYTMMKASTCGRVVCCGSINGQVFVTSVNQKFQTIEKKLHQFKIFEIFLEETKDPDILYVVSHAIHNDIYLLKLDLNCMADSEPVFEILYKLSVPPRFLLMSLSFCTSYDLLICGSRESGLSIYSFHSYCLSCKEESVREISPIIYLKEAHGKQAVTSVVLRMDKSERNDDKDNEEVLTIYTSGRDGGYNKYRLRGLSSKDTRKELKTIEIDVELLKNDRPGSLKKCGDELCEDADREDEIGCDNVSKKSSKKELVSEDGLILEKVYRAKITKGWLEKVIFVDDELMLLGFYRKRFFVYNEDKKFEMFSVACGGAHRTWHFKAKDKRMDKSSFTFIRKENKVRQIMKDLTNANYKKIITEGSVELLTYPLKIDLGRDQMFDNPILFATGAEDSLLRLFQYMPGEIENHLIGLCSIKKHTSVIRSIEWSYGNELLLFSSGAGEELRCWKVEAGLERGQPESNSSSIPLININCLEWSYCPAVSKIPETRIMDISVCPISPSRGLHVIAAVYSDSVLRIWLFDEKKRNFFLIGEAKFHTNCILQVQNLVVPAKLPVENPKQTSNTFCGIVLFTSATDGRVAIWDISGPIFSYLDSYNKNDETDIKFNSQDLGVPIYSYQAHQSGVNCLAIHPMFNCDNRYIIVTGGDDNALSIAYIDILWNIMDDDERMHLIIKPNGKEIMKMEMAHGSSIQGVHMLSDTKILSTSLDQRLNLWEVDFCIPDEMDNAKDKIDIYEGLKLVKSEFVDVCDPNSMDILNINGYVNVAIAGIGIEIFKIR
ncbi:6485_t:CDS:10 [Funneliformis geosporum]|uniref:6485_t:CDS:1 n=1 Tax=Funneliformis geosporum TaxID=1117311 RepID=A0A9W4WUB6_9GLOM|nr:6485_t:CDS:10 [Funneliformis geosporum]